MMEFKVGDRMRYKGAKSHYYTVGNVYELQEARSGAFWLTDDESSEAANHEWDFEGLKANFERVDELQFKVGDKVRVVNVDGITLGEKHYYNGFVTKVLAVSSGIDDAGVVLENKYGVEGVYIDADELMDGVIELVEADGDTAALAKTIEETPVKTANELRAEVIEKAKEFVECKEYYLADSNNEDGRYEAKKRENPKYYRNALKVDYAVNVEKRTVVVLLRGARSNNFYCRGIAKCHADDVFNEHVGKAIALGRALGFDVSEFEQAVQPTEVVVGTRVLLVNLCKLSDVTETVLPLANEGVNSGDVQIINDTNAQYEVKNDGE